MTLSRSWVVMFVISGVLAAAPSPGAAFFEGMPHNGLSSRSFRLNALTSNRRALAQLLQRPLDSALVSDPYILRQLKDPGARAMLFDLVKCALDDETVLVAQDASGTTVAKWRGELGLCEPSAAAGDTTTPVWDASGPNVPCQQIVTACIMSRVNALKKSIPLSLRSEHTALAQIHDRVVTDRKFRESPPLQDPSLGWPVESLMGPTCPTGTPCAWAPAHVGTCTPGTPIALAIADNAACGTAAMRVCGGLHGCYPAGPPYDEPVGFPTPPDPHYSEFRAEKTGVCHDAPLTFTCPTALTTRGYYSVMVKPALQGSLVDGWPDGGLHHRVVKVSGTGSYPASQPEVFGFLEGAFYGNLFEPDNLRRTCEVSVDGARLECVPGAVGGRGDTCSIGLGSAPPTGGVPGSPDGERDACLRLDPMLPHAHVYACFSYAQQAENATDDEVSTAALNERLCDLPLDSGEPCFPTPPRRCRYSDPTRTGSAGCDAIGDDGAYGECLGQGSDRKRYRYIITTWLNEACDLTDNRELCDSIRRTTRTRQSPGGVPGTTQRPHGCGCSAEAGAGDVVSILLAALVAACALRLPGRWRRAEARA